MTTNRSNLIISGLDFDEIKENLKNFLKAQDQFTDYDFEGSGMNVLLDILAYNTHYQAYYANMVANETFLDSCKLVSSAASIAKHLDYIPKSKRASVAYVDVYFTNLSDDIKNSIDNGLSYYVSKGDTFSTKSADGDSLIYNATDSVLVKNNNGDYVASNVEIKEGTYKTVTYVVDNSNTAQKYVIPDVDVDTSTIEVRIQESLENTTGFSILWEEVNDLNKLSSDSHAYFVQLFDDTYEIYFGDGIIGKQPETGNVITIKYLVTNGPLGNDLGKNESETSPTFTYLKDSDALVLLITDSDGNYSTTFGGSDAETLESIKYYAPRNYQAQERAVTPEDYRVLIARQYAEQAESVFVWGGEDNDPPIYGKVFVSIKPKNAKKITQSEKLAIAKSIIKERNLVTITPEIVDPDYLYISISTNVLYNDEQTSLTRSALEQRIKNLIVSYGRSELERFDRSFRYSKFITTIDDLDEAIISNNTTLKLQKKLEPTLNKSSAYNISFDNELYHPVTGYDSIVTTTAFIHYDPTTLSNEICYLDDDGRGNIRLYRLVNQTKVYLNSNQGTINYTTGKITLTNFKPVSLYPTTNTTIDITVIPNKNDVYSRRNLILLFDETSISVNCQIESIRFDPYNSSASSFPFNTGT